MGLDMYMHAKKYVSNYDHVSDEDKDEFAKIVKLANVGEFISDGSPSVEIVATVGCWRKANQIHNWFVNNNQGGIDNCHEYYIGREDLQQLQKECQAVLEDPTVAIKKLPRIEGCFFGEQGYDEWYEVDLRNTVAIIDNCLAMPDCWEFYYRASW